MLGLIFNEFYMQKALDFQKDNSRAKTIGSIEKIVLQSPLQTFSKKVW